MPLNRASTQNIINNRPKPSTNVRENNLQQWNINSFKNIDSKTYLLKLAASSSSYINEVHILDNLNIPNDSVIKIEISHANINIQNCEFKFIWTNQNQNYNYPNITFSITGPGNGTPFTAIWKPYTDKIFTIQSICEVNNGNYKLLHASQGK